MGLVLMVTEEAVEAVQTYLMKKEETESNSSKTH